MSDLVVATWNWDAFMRGFMASGGSVLIVVIAFGLVGAIASVVGLVRGFQIDRRRLLRLAGSASVVRLSVCFSSHSGFGPRARFAA